MAVAFILDFPGATLEQYDAVGASLNAGGNTPPGALSHFAAKTATGLKIVDLWESQEAFQQFFDQHLKNALDQSGVGQPHVTTLDVHAFQLKP
ncbi:MAG: hypothetical protein JST22_00530 [Bacteroidetes bacterium]|nr:hypothetical protein [Bacteroidota bacterium]